MIKSEKKKETKETKHKGCEVENPPKLSKITVFLFVSTAL